MAHILYQTRRRETAKDDREAIDYLHFSLLSNDITNMTVPKTKCDSPNCTFDARFHVNVAQGRKQTEYFRLCESHAGEFLDPFNRRTTFVTPPPQEPALVEFDVRVIVSDETSTNCWIYLEDLEERQEVIIASGVFEATAIARRLQGFHLPRPLTHEAMAGVIIALHGNLNDVVIYKFDPHQQFYFALLRIGRSTPIQDTVEVDVRPSDAINLALICDVPIFVTTDVLRELFRRGQMTGGSENASESANP